jgi:hypothetical protein
MDMISNDEITLSPMAHGDIRQLGPADQQLLLSKILFDQSLNLLDTECADEHDITNLICLFNSTPDQLRILTEDHQLDLRDGASFHEELYANLSDKLIELYNKVVKMFSEYRDSTEELIIGLDNQIATLKKSIESIDPTYYGNTLDEETSPSTPCKRPRLVDSGNSALSSPIDFTMI